MRQSSSFNTNLRAQLQQESTSTLNNDQLHQPNITTTNTTTNTVQTRTRQYLEFSTLDWMHHLHRHTSLETPDTWLTAFIIALLIGILAAWLDVTLDWLSDLKLGVCWGGQLYLSKLKCCSQNWDAYGECDDWYSWSRLFFGIHSFFPINLPFYVGLGCLFAAGSSFVTLAHSPIHGPRSGIPEIKAILGGFLMHRALSPTLLIVKSIGLILSVASGLSIGNKAPLVHIASCVGHLVTRFVPRFRNDPASSTYLLSIASAAGMAVAFGSPIGGILYALEEVSTYFPLPVMGIAFFCCLMATLVLEGLDPFRNESMVVIKVVHDRPWHLFELVPFTILAVGLVGAYFNRINVRIQLARQRSKFCHDHPVRETAILCLGTSFFAYWTIFSRSSMLSLMSGLFRECNDNFNGINVLCSQTSLVWTSIALMYTACLRFITSAITYGTHVPAGAFIPNMLVGACIGRVIGIIVSAIQRSFPDWAIFASCQAADQVCVTPGSYSLLGAAAALTGVTRLTISIVVILFELTGALNFVLPTILAVVIAKFVADASGGSQNGLTNLYIQLMHYPYMDTKDDSILDFAAYEIMCSMDQLIVLRNAMSVCEILHVLESTKVNTFPIVNDFRRYGLQGCITRQDLLFGIASSSPNTCSSVDDRRQVYFNTPVLNAALPPTSLEPPPLDLSLYTDQAPLAVLPKTNGSIVHTLFAKLGLRYMFVKSQGALLGLITRKDMIRATVIVQGGPLGVDRERHAAPDLDPLISKHGARIQHRLRKLRRRSALYSMPTTTASINTNQPAIEFEQRDTTSPSLEDLNYHHQWQPDRSSVSIVNVFQYVQSKWIKAFFGFGGRPIQEPRVDEFVEYPPRNNGRGSPTEQDFLDEIGMHSLNRQS